MSTVLVQKSDATVSLDGALTLAEAQMLRPRLQQAMAEGISSVVFDLGRSDVVDSSGIGLLIATHNSLKTKGSDRVARCQCLPGDPAISSRAMRLASPLHRRKAVQP